jgi:hypothetical protein
MSTLVGPFLLEEAKNVYTNNYHYSLFTANVIPCPTVDKHREDTKCRRYFVKFREKILWQTKKIRNS